MRQQSRARVTGPLGPFAEGYRLELAGLGFQPGPIEARVWEMARLSRWAGGEGLGLSELTVDRVEEFIVFRQGLGQWRPPTFRSLGLLLGHLRDRDVIPSAVVASLTPMEELVGRYRRWLIVDRGLAPSTVRRYEGLARRFLAERSSAASGGGVQGLTGGDVNTFLLGECSRLAVGSAKGVVNELRSLLRFLYLEGLTPLALAAAVPPVAGWRDTGLPATFAPSSVQALLDSCDRSQPMGTRDYAMLLLLARLGLRSAELAGLRFGDVDWRAGEIVVRGKGRREDRLPLPVEVGEALVAYLVDGRPEVGTRQMFVTCCAPLRGVSPGTVSDVVRGACRRAGLPRVGAHRLRHALATEMLAHGAAMVEISQVLRHRDLATTAIYAKVHLGALRQVAQPWPGAGR